MALALVQTGENGNVSPQIQQDVQLHGRVVGLPTCPREKRHAQFDDRGIQSEQICLQLRNGQLPVAIHTLSSPHQHSRHLAEHTPIAMVVGIGQIGSGDSSPDAHAVGQGRTVTEACFDSSQTFPMGKLSKNHRGKVIVNLQ